MTTVMVSRPPKKIVLVACVRRKQSVPTPARELYISPWFKKARAYAEMIAPGSWWILSAQYGLVHPDTVISPYNRTLNVMSLTDREAWATRVLESLWQVEEPETADPALLATNKQIVMLAGRKYREPLLDWLVEAGYWVEVPMKGLGIGQQIQWLDRQLAGGEHP